jgi:hypothetical protein
LKKRKIAVGSLGALDGHSAIKDDITLWNIFFLLFFSSFFIPKEGESHPDKRFEKRKLAAKKETETSHITPAAPSAKRKDVRTFAGIE